VSICVKKQSHWTGRALSLHEPDIHHFGSIKKEMHQGVAKTFFFFSMSFSRQRVRLPGFEPDRSQTSFF